MGNFTVEIQRYLSFSCTSHMIGHNYAAPTNHSSSKSFEYLSKSFTPYQELGHTSLPIRTQQPEFCLHVGSVPVQNTKSFVLCMHIGFSLRLGSEENCEQDSKRSVVES
jgi:hypothetical protein